MNNRLETPNPEVQKAQIRANERRDLKQLDVGVVGRLLGSNQHSSINIAALICILFYLAFLTVLLVPSGMLEGKTDALAIIAGIILPIVGFIFGKGSNQ